MGRLKLRCGLGWGDTMGRRPAVFFLLGVLLLVFSACNGDSSSRHSTATPNGSRSPVAPTPTPGPTRIPTATPTVATPTPTATPACGPGARQLNFVNHCNYEVWLGSTGGARSCSSNADCTGIGTGTCNLPSGTDKKSLTGICGCSTTSSDCGSGFQCNTSIGECFASLPAPISGSLDLKPAGSAGNRATICVPAKSGVQFSGNFWGRTGCPADFATCAGGGQSCTTGADCCNGICQSGQCAPGTPACQTGDCSASYSCPAGVGGNPPASLAEFTLQSLPARDFYDVSIITGPNVPLKIAPIPNTFATSVPAGQSTPYWCGVPGNPHSADGLVGCGWVIAASATPAATPTPDYIDTLQDVAPQPPGGCSTNADCPGTATCDATTHTCSCTSNSQCGTGACGFAKVPGITGVVQACGKLVGYWGAGQLCATAFPNNIGTPLNCDTAQTFNGGTSNFPVDISCTQDGDCPPQMKCDSATGGTDKCVPLVPCTATSCPGGTTCGSNGACVASTPSSCTADSDCSVSEFCWLNGQSSGKCATTATCSTATDCPTLMSCSGGKCIPNNTNLYSANGINAKSCFVPSPVPAGLSEYCGGYKLWTVDGAPLPSSLATPSIPANPQWVNVAKPPERIFKDACPSAYSYQFDDAFSTFQCEGQSTQNQVGYGITFCPAGSPSGPPTP